MSIQFQRQFLMEEDAYGALRGALISMGAGEESASMLVTAVEQGMLTPEKAVSIVKATATMEEEGGSMTAAAGATLEPVRTKKKVREGDFETGLIVVGRTQLDNQKIGEVIEEEGLYAEWNAREGYWFFPEELDLYDGLEKILTQRFEEKDINARFEGVFMEDAPILAGGKIKDNYAVSHFGYKAVPKGHAKMKGIIVKDLWNESVIGEIFTKEDQEKAEAILDKLKNTNSKIYRALISLVLDEYPHSGEEIDQLATKAGLNENYHRFKKETATRTRAQQMHEAAKAIEKRLHEVNKLLEYTSELKNELFEGDDVSEMTHHTKRVFEKVTKNIAEAYSKLKKIK